MPSKENLIKELELCLDLWKQKGGCELGGCTRCSQCATPYLLLKLINGQIFHSNMKRLTLEEWQSKIKELKVLHAQARDMAI